MKMNDFLDLGLNQEITRRNEAEVTVDFEVDLVKDLVINVERTIILYVG